MYADDTYITYAGSDLHLIQSSLSHDLASRRMRRHIRDLNVESARDFKLNQAARWPNNKENDQKMADNAYLFSVYVLHTCVS